MRTIKTQKLTIALLTIIFALAMLMGIATFGTGAQNTAYAADAPTGDFITFSSESSFAIAMTNTTKNWEGKLYYSTSGENGSWNEYSDLNATLSAAQIGGTGDYYLCFRGTGNTRISSSANYEGNPWTITGANVACAGNIETLLDYATVATNGHPTMESCCFAYMFANSSALISAPELSAVALTEGCYSAMFLGCTALNTAPVLPSMNLGSNCYESMFQNCTALTALPELPATALTSSCYLSMFSGCTGIKLFATDQGNGNWSIPASAIEAAAWNSNMLSGTGGDFTGAPVIGATYYYAAPPVATVTFDEDGSGANPAVTTSYATFEEAWNYAVGLSTTADYRATVKLFDNVTAESGSFGTGAGFDNGSIRVPDGKFITLDLNGKTIDRAVGDTAISYGYVITIARFMTKIGDLTLMDSSTTVVANQGAITGANNSLSSGGISVNGTLTMTGGRVVANKCGATGGGVAVWGGTFTMTGGEISGNYSSGGGGGLYADATSTVILSGNAAIKGNVGAVSASGGGGVDVSGTLNLSGNATVSGNFKGGSFSGGVIIGGTPNNVSLPTGKTINITATFTGSVGVTTATAPTAGNPVVITSGWTATNSTGTITSDNTSYLVSSNDTEIVIITPKLFVNISPTLQSKSYTGYAVPYIISGTDSGIGNFVVKYALTGTTPLETTVPTAPGKYDVQITRVADGEYYAYDSSVITAGLVINHTAESIIDENNGFITFSSESSFTISAGKDWDSTLEYSTDGATWTTYAGNNTVLTAAQIGNKGKYYLCFRGTENTYMSQGTAWTCSATTAVECNGNIETLLDYLTVANGNHPSMSDNCFDAMFQNWTYLNSAPRLPATTLSIGCYANMFNGCTNLTSVPALPAQSLVEYCYSSMFQGCTGLTTVPTALLSADNLGIHCYYYMFAACTNLTSVPALPATSLVEGCYSGMFRDCTGLTTVPTDLLPASDLGDSCYHSMFRDCTELTNTPVLSSTTMKTSCYSEMFWGCTSLKRVPNLPATSLADNCYYAMFYNCSGIKLYQNNTTGDTWQIPYDATTSAATSRWWSASMFSFTGGDNISASALTPGKLYYYLPTVTYYDRGEADEIPYTGSAIDDTYKTYTSGEAMDLPDVTKDGLTFIGWYTGYNSGYKVTEISSAAEGNLKYYAKFAVTYTVTYEVQGGDTLDPNQIEVEAGETGIRLAIPTRSGYIFNGWYTAASDGTQWSGSDGINTVGFTSDTTIYAQWTQTYTITYNCGTGTGSKTSDTKIKGIDKSIDAYTSSEDNQAPITKDGHIQVGWAPNQEEYATSDNISLYRYTWYVDDRDVTLYPVWVAKTYAVTLDKNGGTSDGSATATYGSGTLTGFTAPTRTGYTLSGYFTTTSGGSKVINADGTLVASVAGYTDANGKWIKDGTETFYAQWTAKTYTVTLNKNEGTADGSVTATYDSATLTNHTAVTRVGYTLNGYYTETSGGFKVINADGTLVASVGNFIDANGKWVYDGDVTLYSQWTAKTYTVTLDKNDGTAGGSATATYASVTLTDYTAATRTGYTLSGYFTTTSGGSKVINADGTLVASVGNFIDANGKWVYDGTATLYAQWTAKTYNVMFDRNGGTTGSTQVEGVVYGEEMPTEYRASAGYSVVVAPPTRVGYTFVGYYSVNGGSSTDDSAWGTRYYVPYNAERMASSHIWDIDENSPTLYARWTVNTYAVVLTTNGGTINVGDVTTYTYGVGANLPTDVSKTGYTFDGWYTNDGTTEWGDKVTAISNTDTEAKTYYAKWTAKTYAITLDKNDGAADGSATAMYDSDTLTDYTAATRTGYTLSGYFTTTSGGSKVINANGTLVASAEDYTDGSSKWIYDGTATLYAQWTAKTEVSVGNTAQNGIDYNGSAIVYALTGTHKDIGGFKIEYFVNNGWTEDAPTNAGSYDVRVSRLEDDNYKAYNPAVIEKGLVINKIAAVWVIEATAKTLTYTGTAQELVNVGSAEGGTIKFLVDGMWVTTIPTGIDATTYIVNCKVIGDINHTESTNCNLRVKISQKQLTVSGSTITAKDYDGNTTATVVLGTVSGVIGGESVTVTPSGTYADANAGTGKTVTASYALSGADSSNYLAPVNENLTGNINKINYNMSSVAWNYSTPFTYDGNAKSVTVTNLPTGVTVKAYTDNTKTDAGTYTASVTFNYDTVNYNTPTLANCEWTINQATNEFTTAVAITGWIYGDNANIPTSTAKFGTPVYSYSTEQDGTYGNIVPTNARTYWVRASVAETDNYASAESKTSFTIEQKTATLSWAAITDLVYSNTAKMTTATVSNLETGDVCNVTVSLTVGKDNVNVGSFTYTATALSNANYKLPTNVTSGTYTITAKDIIFTVVDVATGNVSYDNTAKTTTATYTDLCGGDTVTYVLSYSDNVNAGTCTVTIASASVNSGLASNYNLITSDTGTIVIDKAQAIITVDQTAIVKTYGDTWTLPTATTNFGTVICDKTVVDMVNVNSYTVTYSVEATDNYFGDSKLVSVTINKQKVNKPTADDTVFIADGTNKTYTILSDSRYTVSGNVKSEVGSFAVTVALNDTANYEWLDGTTANLNFEFVIRQPQLAEKTDETAEKDDVIVTTENGFAPDVTISITVVPETEATNVSANVAKNEEVVLVYDIKLFIGDAETQPDGTITIRILIPTECVGKNYRILHVHNGEMTEMQYTVDGDYAVVTTDRLSEFVFIADKDINSLVWLIILLSVLILAEIALAVYKLRKDKNSKKSVKTYSFMPLLLAAFIPAGQLGAAVALGVVAVLGGVFDVYLYLFKDKTPKKDETATSSDEENKALSVESDASVATTVETQPIAETSVSASEESSEILTTTEDNDEEESVVFKGIEEETGLAILVRYRKSFTARLIQSPDETKAYYGELKNALLSYKKTTSRISWNYDSINSGRTKLAKLNVRGKTLCLYLALNPDDYIGTKYKVERSISQKYKDTPCLYKIKNERRAKYAFDLIAILAEKVGLQKGESQNANYYLPYESTEALIEKQLIKELISKEKYEDYQRRQSQAEVNANKRTFVSASEVDSVLRDEVAATLIVYEKSAFVGKKVKGIVNIDSISDKYALGETVNLVTLKEKKLLKDTVNNVKILARGTLNKPLTVEANEFSIEAVKMILLTGGKAIKIT